MRTIFAAVVFIVASSGQSLGREIEKRPGRQEQRSIAASHKTQVIAHLDKIKPQDADYKKAGEVLKLALKQNGLLQKYHTAVDQLLVTVSEAYSCYNDYQSNGVMAIHTPYSMENCDGQYDKAGKLLSEAKEIMRQTDFPLDSWVREQKLPVLTDGREDQLDEQSEKLHRSLVALVTVAKLAYDHQKQAIQVQDYHAQVGRLTDSISATEKCYSAVSEEIHTNGVESAEAARKLMEPCDTDHNKVQANFDAARETVRAPGFATAEVLAQFQLPDFRDGFESRQDGKTQGLTQAIEQLKRTKEELSKIEKEDIVYAQEFKEALQSELSSPELVRIISEPLNKVLKYSVVREGKDDKDAWAAINATKQHGNQFLQDLLDKSAQIAHMAIQEALSNATVRYNTAGKTG
ncbi:hypothetical protein NOR_06208 [Metarhizium rileyi]|uniref:Uncharacterized protein n=1 Tax=Metarhizium rileyi (strain RCEF 4871) TaxID=1649241 RepID=A0A167AVK4_METRR|nr:hypothetical protein NOR_06208 [Metarhizium rileyi RCEF 4871]